MASPVETAAQVGASLLQADLVAALRDDEAAARIRDAIKDDVAPDLECVMVAPDWAGPGGRLEYSGVDGFIAAWREWLEAYESYAIEVGEIVEGTEGRVMMLGRQRGRTRTGGVEVEQLAAAVWTVRDGRVERMEFHLDPDAARRAAGLD